MQRVTIQAIIQTQQGEHFTNYSVQRYLCRCKTIKLKSNQVYFQTTKVHRNKKRKTTTTTTKS